MHSEQMSGKKVSIMSTEYEQFTIHSTTHHVLIVIRGMGAQVKNTVIRRKNLRPHTSDSAPINGALRNDNRPCKNVNIK